MIASTWSEGVFLFFTAAGVYAALAALLVLVARPIFRAVLDAWDVATSEPPTDVKGPCDDWQRWRDAVEEAQR